MNVMMFLNPELFDNTGYKLKHYFHLGGQTTTKNKSNQIQATKRIFNCPWILLCRFGEVSSVVLSMEEIIQTQIESVSPIRIAQSTAVSTEARNVHCTLYNFITIISCLHCTISFHMPYLNFCAPLHFKACKLHASA